MGEDSRFAEIDAGACAYYAGCDAVATTCGYCATHCLCGASPHSLTEYGTTDCPIEQVRANVDDGICSACGTTVITPVESAQLPPGQCRCPNAFADGHLPSCGLWTTVTPPPTSGEGS